MRRVSSFAEFYPHYLDEHRHPASRRLHFAGSLGALVLVAVAVLTREGWWLAAAVACGYGLAWIGHFAFEKNQPATFRHPLYSFMGDWRMFADILRGRVRL